MASKRIARKRAAGAGRPPKDVAKTKQKRELSSDLSDIAATGVINSIARLREAEREAFQAYEDAKLDSKGAATRCREWMGLAEQLRKSEATALTILEDEGKLISAEVVRSAWVRRSTTLRTMLEGIPSSVSEKCAGKDASAIFEILTAEIEAALHKLSDEEGSN